MVTFSLHSTLHQCPLINHTIWLLVRPSPDLVLSPPLLPLPTLSPRLHFTFFSSPLLPPLLIFYAVYASQTVLQGLFSSVCLSTDISAPWFQSNYIRINDYSPWMHLSVSPSGTGPGALQSLSITLQEGVWISLKFIWKDKKSLLISFSWFQSNYIRITLPLNAFPVRLTGKRPAAQQSHATSLQERVAIAWEFVFSIFPQHFFAWILLTQQLWLSMNATPSATYCVTLIYIYIKSHQGVAKGNCSVLFFFTE